MEGFRNEGGLIVRHGFLLLDGSGSMCEGRERASGKPKHRAVAEMVQDLIGILKEDDDIEDVLLTVICYCGINWMDIRLSAYDLKRSEDHDRTRPYDNKDLDRWDPAINHCGTTPIGRALAFARQRAEQWISDAPQGNVHRAVICLLSDGMQYPLDDKPDPLEEKNAILAFNKQQTDSTSYKGRIRIATVGYYQYAIGENTEEDAGRELLHNLASPESAYFESGNASEIAGSLKRSVASA